MSSLSERREIIWMENIRLSYIYTSLKRKEKGNDALTVGDIVNMCEILHNWFSVEKDESLNHRGYDFAYLSVFLPLKVRLEVERSGFYTLTWGTTMYKK